jgi:hypothetical protein
LQHPLMGARHAPHFGSKEDFCMAVMTGKTICAGLVSAAALFAVATSPVRAQSPAPADVSTVYRPGLGDLMAMTGQPRHIKLALAGRQKNWTYAAYELHELQEAFDRAAKA